MYKKIMVPIDLAHADRLEKALTTAADLAKHYGATVAYVAVNAATPGPLGHNPAEFAARLEAFAASEANRHGITATAVPKTSHDPARDLGPTLLETIREEGIDLVVMASHVPGVVEHFFSSHAGHIAAHATISVFVIR